MPGWGARALAPEPVSRGSLRPAGRGRRRMNEKGHGQLRRSQMITTFGPGALIDLPNDSAIMGGLDLGQRGGPGRDRRAAPLGQARGHDRRSRPAPLRPAAGAGGLAGPAAGHRRVALPRVVRGAGVRRRQEVRFRHGVRFRHEARRALAAPGAAHRPHQRPLREEAGRGDALRPRLLQGRTTAKASSSGSGPTRWPNGSTASRCS